jgi:integrase
MTFTSIFKAEFEEYLALRKKTLAEESYEQTLYVLRSFDCCLSELGVGAKTVSEEMINAWIKPMSGTNAKRTINGKVACLRKFLEYLRYSGFAVFMPACPKCPDGYVPYLFSDEEMEIIFKEADAAEPKQKNPKRRLTQTALPMLLRLLYSCGLRVGEALNLKAGDIDFERGTLFMRHPKNGKQRIVPMHESLTPILKRYCMVLGIAGKPDAFVFPGSKPGRHLSGNAVHGRFLEILKATGIHVPRAPHKRGQCPHCLRHLFAVKSFAQASLNGRSAYDSVPFLSVYLGHRDMDCTEKYLKFSSDIFPEHSKMFEEYAAAAVFSVPGGEL